jgi:chemotaxis protein MotB
MFTARTPKRNWLKVTPASRKNQRVFKPSKGFLRNIKRLAKNKRPSTEEELLEDYDIENPTVISSESEEQVSPAAEVKPAVVQTLDAKRDTPAEQARSILSVPKSPENSNTFQALFELNGRFLNLKKQVQTGKDEKEKLQQEKSLLAREIRRLRKNLNKIPSANLIAKLQHSPKQKNSKFQKPHQLDPELVNAYKSSLQEQVHIKNLKQQSLIAINKLKLQLEKLQAERNTMETKLKEEQIVFDQNLGEISKRLKDKSKVLRLKIENEQNRKKKLHIQQNSIKIEIRGLRDNQDKIHETKEKIYSIEQETNEAQERRQGLLGETKDLTLSIERFVAEQSRINLGKYNDRSKLEDERKSFNRILGQLRNDHGLIAQSLNEGNDFLNQNLSGEVEKIENEFQESIKFFRRKKSSLGEFTNDVIEKPEAPIWMVSYADLTTIILTFFILYFAITKADIAKFKSAILGQGSPSVRVLELLDSPQLNKNLVERSALNPENILSDVSDLTKGRKSFDVSTSKSRVEIRVPGGTLFPEGSADLQKEAIPVLNEVIDIVKKYPQYQVKVRGHTDDTPIATEKFPTNWELSSSRATAVLRHFIDRGIPADRITASGFADTFPLVSNDKSTGRSINRRVEIMLEKPKS